MRPGGVHRGGAPRSELKYYMIASGNHTTISSVWRAGARLTVPLVTASFGSFLAGARKEWTPDRKINDHL